MDDYVIAGLAIFRYIEPRFIDMSDKDLKDLYRIWSDEQACASWLGVTNKGAEQFCKWAFITPFDWCNKK